MEKRLSFVLASFLALAGTVSPLHAQATGGTLSGTVKDGTGGIVPGVTVVIVNTDTSLDAQPSPPTPADATSRPISRRVRTP